MIRIVCAYSDLMNLYGEYAAPLFLKARLQRAGEEVEISRFTLGETPDLHRCDLLLFSAGTERSMLRALDDLRDKRAEIAEYIRANGRVLLTGNAGALFANSVTEADGTVHEGLGLLDGTVSLTGKRRYAEYIMHGARLGRDIIGSINTSAEFRWNETPLFEVEFQSEKLLPEKSEGAVKNNVLATQLTGPLLVRNPHVLDRTCASLLGKPLPPCTASWRVYSEAGYASALATLKKESGRA